MSFLAPWPNTIRAIADTWTAVALESTVKGSVVLLLALAVARLARNLSAASKHLLWVTCVALLLGLPVLSAAIPNWSVNVPNAGALAALRRLTTSVPDRAPPESHDPRERIGTPVAQRAPSNVDAVQPERASSSSALPIAETQMRPSGFSFDWGERLFLLWIAGAAMVVLWTIIGVIAMGSTLGRATPVSLTNWLALARALEREIGIRRPTRLLHSESVAVPMTCGVLAPAIVLPTTALDWSAERMQVVLLHELAHVKRRDCLVQVVAQMASALYWFHPLVWYAAARLRAERERACDDVVLRGGTTGPEYATQLLDLARSYRSLPSAALAMARPSQLEGRLLAILAPSLDRRAISPTIARRAMIAASCIALPLAALNPRAVIAAAPRAEAAAPVIAPVDAAVIATSTPIAAVDSATPSPAVATVPVLAAQDIIFHPRPGDPLRSRLDWARQEAQRRSLSRGYWIAYAIPVQRDDERRMITSGSEGWQIDELNEPSLSRLLARARAELRDAPPALDIPEEAAAAILLRYSSPSSELARPSELKVRSLTLGVELDGRPVLWLGGATDQESLPVLRELYAAAGTSRMKEALISSISVHRSSDVVVPFLRSVLESDAATDERAQAAEGLAYHDTQDALGMLVRVSTNDRSTRVREEAVEALGDMQLAESLDALTDLLKTLQGTSVRLEAVEALGAKNSDRAAAALAEIAMSDDRTDVQREAVETLGEVPEERGLSHLLRLARSHDSPDVRAEVAETLAELSPSQTVLDALRRLVYEDRDVRVQKEAVESIADLEDGAGSRLLDEIARDHPNPEVREEAREKRDEARDKRGG